MVFFTLDLTFTYHETLILKYQAWIGASRWELSNAASRVALQCLVSEIIWGGGTLGIPPPLSMAFSWDASQCRVNGRPSDWVFSSSFLFLFIYTIHPQVITQLHSRYMVRFLIMTCCCNRLCVGWCKIRFACVRYKKSGSALCNINNSIRNVQSTSDNRMGPGETNLPGPR